MPRHVVEYRVLIISPGDMSAARDAVRVAISDWNAHVGVSKDVRLEAVGWESHAHPATGDEPQAIINGQLVDHCDIGIALFGTRLGSPTSSAESGSVEEIDRLVARGAKVLIYQSVEPIRLHDVDTVQVDALRSFLSRMKHKALLGQFETSDKLRHLVTLHLTRVIDEILAGPSPTAGQPGVRAEVGARLASEARVARTPVEAPAATATTAEATELNRRKTLVLRWIGDLGQTRSEDAIYESLRAKLGQGRLTAMIPTVTNLSRELVSLGGNYGSTAPGKNRLLDAAVERLARELMYQHGTDPAAADVVSAPPLPDGSAEVLSVWSQLEGGLHEIAREVAVAGEPRATVTQLVDELRTRNVLSKPTRNSILALQGMRNLVEPEGPRRDAEGRNFLAMANALNIALNSDLEKYRRENGDPTRPGYLPGDGPHVASSISKETTGPAPDQKPPLADGLRAKLNAQAEIERANATQARVDRETVLREYPRLVADLLSRIGATLEGVDDIKIEPTVRKESLIRGRSVVGAVEVPHWTVRLGSKKITFTPGGTDTNGFWGVQGSIDVVREPALPANKFPRGIFGGGGIMMVEDRDNWSVWSLKIRDEKNPMKLLELTDAELRTHLERGLTE